MARYTPEVAYIGSIFPGKLEPIRRSYGPSRESYGPKASRSTLFQLEPVKRGEKPFLLEVCDSFEDVLDLSQIGASSDRKSKPRMPKPVPVEVIVEDILRVWTGGLFNVPAGAKPGIGEVHPQKHTNGSLVIPVVELKQLEQQQTEYFQWNFQEGERLHKQSNWKEITDTMRLAAEWLGYQRDWSHRAIAADSGPCPLCQTIISNTAIFCTGCHQQIRKMPDDIAKLQAANRIGA